MAGRLIKAKSQELLEGTDSGGFIPRMKKVFQTSPMSKMRRTQSLLTSSHDGNSKAFGVPLNKLLTPNKPKLSLPSSTAVEKIPHIVKKIVKHVEEHGLNQEGIYRINGNTKLIESLRTKFNQDGDADLHGVDIYSVGNLLKLFLRQLPVSLVPAFIIDKVVELQESTSGSYTTVEITRVKSILTLLPEEHYQLLKYLCKHLYKVSEHSNINKMTFVSLSIVFGPNVFRCGGELADIKKQGYANASFAQMIQNHEVIFDKEEEQLRLKTISENSSDEVFLITNPTKVSTPIKKEKPKVVPYHEHIAQKERQQSITVSRSISWPTSPVNDECFDSLLEENDPIPHERSIDEAIEANTNKHLSATDVTHKSKSLSISNSDDALTTRFPSPYSWKSSPGTTPPTSPVNSPRTSQVYTSLIGDTVQDHLFQSNSLQSEKSAVTKDNGQVNQSVPNDANSISLRETNFKRRNKKVSRNRKSAVYGTGLTQEEIHIITADIDTHTNDEMPKALEEHDNVNEVKETTSIKKTIELLEQKGLPLKLAIGKKETTTTCLKEDFTSTNQTLQTHVDHDTKELVKNTETYTSHDFDYVTKRIQTLIHPTLNRARGPHNRRRPKLLEGNTSATNESDSKKASLEGSVNVSQSKKEKCNESNLQHTNEDTKTDELLVDTTQTEVAEPSIPPVTSVSMFSRQGSLSSPSNDVGTVQRLSPVMEARHVQQQVAPEDDAISNVSTGWTNADVENKEETKTYKELIEEAKSLKAIIKSFEADFLAKMGYKPSNEESASIAKEITSLTEIKKRIRALRFSKEKLSKTVPSRGHSADDTNVSLSVETKRATVRRHQSLNISPTHAKINELTPYKQILDGIMTTISQKRQSAGRPDDLKLMTLDQLLAEKHCVQKSLLQYEKQHGRPQSSDVKIIMRPLYNYYKDIKIFLVSLEKEKSLYQTSDKLVDTADSSMCSVTLLQSSSLASPETIELKKQKQTQETLHFTQSKSSKFAATTTNYDPQPARSKKLYSKSVNTSQVPSIADIWLSDDQLETASISELQHQLILTKARKKELRKDLQTFETEFTEKHKRTVQKEDKKIMYKQYFEYKKMKVRLLKIENILLKYGPQILNVNIKF